MCVSNNTAVLSRDMVVLSFKKVKNISLLCVYFSHTDDDDDDEFAVIHAHFRERHHTSVNVITR